LHDAVKYLGGVVELGDELAIAGTRRLGHLESLLRALRLCFEEGDSTGVPQNLWWHLVFVSQSLHNKKSRYALKIGIADIGIRRTLETSI